MGAIKRNCIVCGSAFIYQPINVKGSDGVYHLDVRVRHKGGVKRKRETFFGDEQAAEARFVELYNQIISDFQVKRDTNRIRKCCSKACHAKTEARRDYVNRRKLLPDERVKNKFWSAARRLFGTSAVPNKCAIECALLSVSRNVLRGAVDCSQVPEKINKIKKGDYYEAYR